MQQNPENESWGKSSYEEYFGDFESGIENKSETKTKTKTNSYNLTPSEILWDALTPEDINDLRNHQRFVDQSYYQFLDPTEYNYDYPLEGLEKKRMVEKTSKDRKVLVKNVSHRNLVVWMVENTLFLQYSKQKTISLQIFYLTYRNQIEYQKRLEKEHDIHWWDKIREIKYYQSFKLIFLNVLAVNKIPFYISKDMLGCEENEQIIKNNLSNHHQHFERNFWGGEIAKLSNKKYFETLDGIKIYTLITFENWNTQNIIKIIIGYFEDF